MPERVKIGSVLWDEEGRLLPGLHPLTLEQLRPLVATTAYRRNMWNRLMAFLTWPIMSGSFSYAFLGGRYVSDARRPHDVDLILQTREPYGAEAFRAVEFYFRSGLESINSVFGIHLHFWMEDSPASFMDYRVFFQYAKPERPPDANRRGLICISLLCPDIKVQLERMLGGFEPTDDLVSAPDRKGRATKPGKANLDRLPKD